MKFSLRFQIDRLKNMGTKFYVYYNVTVISIPYEFVRGHAVA
jgi:hypothetical protein